jgi:hypothetical protein
MKKAEQTLNERRTRREVDELSRGQRRTATEARPHGRIFYYSYPRNTLITGVPR